LLSASTGLLSLLELQNGRRPLNHNSDIHPDSILVNKPGDEIPQFVFHALLTNPLPEWQGHIGFLLSYLKLNHNHLQDQLLCY